MKKLKKLFRFILISSTTLVIFTYVCHFLFNLFWNFDILNMRSYKILANYWNTGGTFKEFKELSLCVSLILFPILWVRCSIKMYKKGFFKTLMSPVLKLYRKVTRPKNMEPEHVSIKNLGSKERTLDEIISDKLKEKGESLIQNKESISLRQQISAKIEENEKQ